jgi:N4-gp56 family major capsid protein
MALTSYPLNHPQAVKKWSGDLFKDTLEETYALRFMGNSSNSMVQIRKELKSDGDRVRVGLRMQLTGTGVSGDSTLEDQEEALAVYSDDVFIDQLRHAVRSAGKMSEQRVPFSVRDEAKEGLADWFSNMIDTGLMNQLAGYTDETDVKKTGMQAAIATSTGHALLAGDAAGGATASLGTSDVYTFSIIDVAVERAKTLMVPLRPVKVGATNMFVNLIHTYQLTSIRRSTSNNEFADIQKAVLNSGRVNPEDSPIFTGAAGIYNNTVIHDSVRIPSSLANTRRAVFCGAQSACVAFGKNGGPNQFSWVEKLFDYDNQLGVAAGLIWGLKKTVFAYSADTTNNFGNLVITSYAAAGG